jgi:hypothetical protein
MSPSVFRKQLERLYAAEITTMALLLYALGAFVHLSFNPEAWDIVTRIVLGAIFAVFIVFAMVVGSMKGGGR